MYYSTILLQEISSAFANMALASALAVGSMASPGATIADSLGDGDLPLEGIVEELEISIPVTEKLGEDEYLVFEFPEKPQVVGPRVVYAPKPEMQGVQTVSQPQVQSTPKPYSVPASDLDGLFAQYGNEYGVDPEKLKKIAYCESHYYSGAVNGPYLGMYQYTASTWASTRTAMGLDGDPSLRANAEESIRTTAWKIAHGGIGAWPVCGKR